LDIPNEAEELSTKLKKITLNINKESFFPQSYKQKEGGKGYVFNSYRWNVEERDNDKA
jgi:hypothetical protein